MTNNAYNQSENKDIKISPWGTKSGYPAITPAPPLKYVLAYYIMSAKLGRLTAYLNSGLLLANASCSTYSQHRRVFEYTFRCRAWSHLHENNGTIIELGFLCIFDNSCSSTSRTIWKYVQKWFVAAYATFVYFLGIPPQMLVQKILKSQKAFLDYSCGSV